ncbi:hypothetical protein BJ508DRAFT_410259 [Ascobolus immersus RN42]|uniref:Structure-specific endonuclease subunit SLX4 n=1 Tax=Ascobolus immersus RN42 TaxID=1160509 RepID=A0A3N4ITA5_ASCIM|nr:hypothetical protein BJ508DRAFT_410259 [Ascobolus immersus RN42]
MAAINDENRHPMALDASPLPAATSPILRRSPRNKASRFDDDSVWDFPLTQEVASAQQPPTKLQSILNRLRKEDSSTLAEGNAGKKTTAQKGGTTGATEGDGAKPKRVRKAAANAEEKPKAPRKPRTKKKLGDDGLGQSPFFANAKQSKPVSAPATKKKSAPKTTAATKAEPILISSSPTQPDLPAQEVVARRTDWTPVRNTTAKDEVVLLSDCSNASGRKRKAAEFEGLISSLTFDKGKIKGDAVTVADKAAPTTKRRCSDDGFEAKHSTKSKPVAKPKKAAKPKAEPKPRKPKAKSKTMYDYAVEKLRRDQGLDEPVEKHTSILDYFGGDDITNKHNDAPQLTPNTMMKEATFGTFSQLARGDGRGFEEQRREWTREELEKTRYAKGSLLAAAAEAPDGEVWDEDVDKFCFRRKSTQEIRESALGDTPMPQKENTPEVNMSDSPISWEETPERKVECAPEPATAEVSEFEKERQSMEHVQEVAMNDVPEAAILTELDMKTEDEREATVQKPTESSLVPARQASSSPVEAAITPVKARSPTRSPMKTRKSQVIEIPDSGGSNGTLSDSIEDDYDDAILSYAPASYQIPEFTRPKPEIIDLSDSPVKKMEIADSMSDGDSEDYGIDDPLDISIERLEREAVFNTQTVHQPTSMVDQESRTKSTSAFSFSDSDSDEPLLSRTKHKVTTLAAEVPASDISEPEEPAPKPRGRPKKKTPSPATTISEPEEPARKPKRQVKKKAMSEAEPVDPNRPDYNALTTTELTLKIKRMGLKPIKTRKGMVQMLERCWALQHPAPKAIPTTQVPSSQPETPKATAAKSRSKTTLPPSPTAEEIPLHEAIHRAITTSEKPRGQAYHLKILTYEPLPLEELTDWLNDEGLRDVGYVDYVVSAKVRDWCDEKGVCLFSSGGWANSRETRGRGRSRSVEPISAAKSAARGRVTKRKTAAAGVGKGRKKKVVEDSDSEREYLDVQ